MSGWYQLAEIDLLQICLHQLICRPIFAPVITRTNTHQPLYRVYLLHWSMQLSNQPVTLQQLGAFSHADMIEATCWSSNGASERAKKSDLSDFELDIVVGVFQKLLICWGFPTYDRLQGLQRREEWAQWVHCEAKRSRWCHRSKHLLHPRCAEEHLWMHYMHAWKSDRRLGKHCLVCWFSTSFATFGWEGQNLVETTQKHGFVLPHISGAGCCWRFNGVGDAHGCACLLMAASAQIRQFWRHEGGPTQYQQGVPIKGACRKRCLN